ncbi:MAG: Asp23/Gls24 family envelope stress response protein [Peptostreptococcales bacterium]
MGVTIEKENGMIKITDEVIAAIVNKVVLTIEGVAEMSGGLQDSITNIISKHNPFKGIKISSTEQEIVVDVYITVHYGVKIPEVAWSIQEAVKKEIENSLELRISAINIHVQGVVLPQ